MTERHGLRLDSASTTTAAEAASTSTAPVVARSDDDRPPSAATKEETATSPVQAEPSEPGNRAARRRWYGHPAVLIGGLVLVIGVIPLGVALVNLRDPQWYPVMDHALIELRVRDIGEGHPPLVGAYGRIFGFGHQGSHPGPLLFWALFPVYWLLGRTAWALQVATTSLNVAAMATAVWLGYRRGGRPLALGLGLAVVLLARSYGIEKLTMVWNPYAASLWWMVFLLAVWSLVCEDFVPLPVAVLAGSFCIQAHYAYLGPVGVVGGVAAIAVVVSVVRRRAKPERRRSLVRWGLPAAGLLALAWLPPLIEQLTHTPGNLSVLRDAILHPSTDRLVTEEPSLSHTTEVWLAHLDVGTLLSHTRASIATAPEGPLLPGVLLLGAWVVAVGVTWRARLRGLTGFHLTVGAALVAGFAAIHAITGDTWDYLVLWAWGTTALVGVAVVMTAAAVLARTGRPRWLAEAGWPWRPAIMALATAIAVATVAFTYDAHRADYISATAQSELVGRVAPDTVTALRRGDVPGGGDGRYLVLWGEDARWSGMAGFGFFLDLDRHGVDVGVAVEHATLAGGDHRVLDPADADAAIHLVLGPRNIERWDATPGAVRVAFYEPRSEDGVAEYEQLEREVKEIFVAEGRPELVPLLDSALSTTALVHPPPEATERLDRMIELGLPGAVFVAPIDVQPAA